jgi:hypothetical protein
MGETGAGVARGLWTSQQFTESYGIIVNNKVTYRMAEHVVNQKGTDDLVKRFAPYTGSNNNFNYTGGYLGICHWLGADQFENSDNTVAFPGYSTKTRGQLKSAYDDYKNAAFPLWNSGTKNDPYNWLDHFWLNGDYLSGSASGVYNKPLGSTFNMFLWSSGISYCFPGIEQIGAHDWAREISIHLLRGQAREYNQAGGGFSNGKFQDNLCTPTSHSCNYHPPYWSSVLAGRTLAAIQNMGSLQAVCMAAPNPVTAGDTVTFDHSASCTGLNLDIISYCWDISTSDGLWWETGDTADFITIDSTECFQYVFTYPGTDTATLFVRDNYGHWDTASVIITVNLPVPASLTLNNDTVSDGESSCYAATATITVSDFVVQSGGSANLAAGQSVLLQPETTVEPGGYLHAWIDTEGNYCDFPGAMVAVLPEGPLMALGESGVPEKKGPAIRIYPNPTTGIFHVELHDPCNNGTIRIELYSAMGKKVMEQSLSGVKQYTLDLTACPDGIYVLQCFSGNGVEVMKIIKY